MKNNDRVTGLTMLAIAFGFIGIFVLLMIVLNSAL